jgi:phosphoribosyl-AMP cyclohydrolase
MIELDFEKSGGLVPAIAQDYRTGEVLMMAFVNRESWELTLSTGIVHYWSRSRNKLWKKGESSGNVQKVMEIRVDCDNDCVLLKIDQIGEAACHTGFRSCFYRMVKGDSLLRTGSRCSIPRPFMETKNERHQAETRHPQGGASRTPP